MMEVAALGVGFAIGFAFGVVVTVVALLARKKPQQPPPVTETTPRHRTMWG